MLHHKGTAITLKLLGCYSPFNLSSVHENYPRKTLTLRLPKELDVPLERMEKEIVALVSKRSHEFFLNNMSPEQVKENYKPISVKKPRDDGGFYPRQLRVKCNHGGVHPTRYWSNQKTRIDKPETLADTTLNLNVQLGSLWISEDGPWGLCATVSDIQLAEDDSTECPFN